MLNAKPKNSITEEEVYFNKNIKGKLLYCNYLHVDFKNTETLIFKENGALEWKITGSETFWKLKGKTIFESGLGMKVFDNEGNTIGYFKFQFGDYFDEDRIKSSNFYNISSNSDYILYNPANSESFVFSVSRTEKEYNERQVKAEERYLNSFIGSWQNSEEYDIKNVSIKKDEQGKYVIKLYDLKNSETSFNESFELDYKYDDGYYIGKYSTSSLNLYDERYFYITKVYLNIENNNLILQADFASNPGTELDPNSAVKGYKKMILYNVSKIVEDAFK